MEIITNNNLSLTHVHVISVQVMQTKLINSGVTEVLKNKPNRYLQNILPKHKRVHLLNSIWKNFLQNWPHT